MLEILLHPINLTVFALNIIMFLVNGTVPLIMVKLAASKAETQEEELDFYLTADEKMSEYYAEEQSFIHKTGQTYGSLFLVAQYLLTAISPPVNIATFVAQVWHTIRLVKQFRTQ